MINSYNECSPFLEKTIQFLSYLKMLQSQGTGIINKIEMLPETQTGINKFLEEYDISLNIIDKMTFVDHSDWWYKMESADDNGVNFLLPLIALELSLYSKEFIKNKIKLKQIILCNSILFHTDNNEQFRDCLPDYEPDIQGLVFSCKERNLKFLRNTIHHEFFHYINYVVRGSFGKIDNLWEMFNPIGFYYGNQYTWNDKDILKNDYSINSSFVSHFSLLSIDEDKAEIFAFLITSGIDTQYLQQREGVMKKCIYIKNSMEEIDNNNFFQGKDDFWKRAIKYKKDVVDKFYLS